jgi:hypothetical protein
LESTLHEWEYLVIDHFDHLFVAFERVNVEVDLVVGPRLWAGGLHDCLGYLIYEEGMHQTCISRVLLAFLLFNLDVLFDITNHSCFLENLVDEVKRLAALVDEERAQMDFHVCFMFWLSKLIVMN